VLLIGDSTLTPVMNVGSVLAQFGRCAQVWNHAANGTAPVWGNLSGTDWQVSLPILLAQLRPTAVVIEFIGNGFTDGNLADGSWLALLKAGERQLITDVQAAGAHAYVAIPPDALAYPVSTLIGMGQFIAWQRGTDLGATKIDQGVNLAPGGFTGWLSFSNGIQRVRPDMVHVTPLGASIEGWNIAAGLQAEWVAGPPPITAATTTASDTTTTTSAAATGPPSTTTVPATTIAPSTSAPTTTNPS
jgi:hypothetical protein